MAGDSSITRCPIAPSKLHLSTLLLTASSPSRFSHLVLSLGYPSAMKASLSLCGTVLGHISNTACASWKSRAPPAPGVPSHLEGRNGEEAGKRSRRRRRQRGADNVRRTAAATAERERGRRKANSLGSGTGNHIKKAFLPLEAAKNLEILT